MKTSTETTPDQIRLKIAGHFDMNTHQIFRNTYRKLIADCPQKELIVDLGEVNYVDSSALGMLLLLRQDTEAKGIKVSLARCNPFVSDILRTAHFDRLFTLLKQ